MKKFFEYLELILTGAGLLIVAVVFWIAGPISPWRAAAICAVVVGILHGIIFFIVRNAQRHARNTALNKIRHTLNDLVQNKLDLIMYTTQIPGEDWRQAAQAAVRDIQQSINKIEAESLTASK